MTSSCFIFLALWSATFAILTCFFYDFISDGCTSAEHQSWGETSRLSRGTEISKDSPTKTKYPLKKLDLSLLFLVRLFAV
jgi:uncharacterized protein involved in cysteine biosynthesis